MTEQQNMVTRTREHDSNETTNIHGVLKPFQKQGKTYKAVKVGILNQ